MVQPQPMAAQEEHAPRAADDGNNGTRSSTGASMALGTSGQGPPSLLRFHAEMAAASEKQGAFTSEQAAEQARLATAEEKIPMKTAESETEGMISELGREEVKAEESNLCVVCLDGKRSHLFAPCGHQCACVDCAKLLEHNGDPCPICRNQIESVVRVFQP